MGGQQLLSANRQEQCLAHSRHSSVLPLKISAAQPGIPDPARTGLSSPVPRPRDPTSSPRSRRGLRPRARHVTAGRCPPFLLSMWTALPHSHPAWRTASTAGPPHLARFAVVPSVPPAFPAGPTASRGREWSFLQSFGPGTSYSCRGEQAASAHLHWGHCHSSDSPMCPCKSEISSHISFFQLNEFILEIKNQSASAGGAGLIAGPGRSHML